MGNSSKSDSAFIHDQVPQIPEKLRPLLRRREIEQLQDIIIRAHYLAMELRDICAESNVGSRHLSLSAGHMLKT